MSTFSPSSTRSTSTIAQFLAPVPQPPRPRCPPPPLTRTRTQRTRLRLRVRRFWPVLQPLPPPPPLPPLPPMLPPPSLPPPPPHTLPPPPLPRTLPPPLCPTTCLFHQHRSPLGLLFISSLPWFLPRSLLPLLLPLLHRRPSSAGLALSPQTMPLSPSAVISSTPWTTREAREGFVLLR